MRRSCFSVVFLAVVLLSNVFRASAEEPPIANPLAGELEQAAESVEGVLPRLLPDALETPTGFPNLVTPTLGGTQLWGDELIYGDWRIQQQARLKHYRLLGPRDLRYAWGSYEDCRAKLDQLIEERGIEPARGRVVVVLHGLMRSRDAMLPVVRYLEKHGDFAVVNFGYPTTQRTVAEHAASLDRVVRGLDEATEIHFVAHSLGNLVVRHYLADQTDPAAGRMPDRRIKRMVMLTPPNQGALIAEAPVINVTFQAVAGKPFDELAQEWERLDRELATPRFEFGILAGGTRGAVGWNPLLPGDNDGVVRVEEARLSGAKDFAVLTVNHSLIMYHPQALEYTLRFLEEGRFAERAR